MWEEFLERFNIPHLAEFYGSTEGNVSFINFDGKPGAIGRIPGWLKSQFAHVAFVKFDIETEQPVRGPDGFCVPADRDEPGEAIGRIDRFMKPARQRRTAVYRDGGQPGWCPLLPALSRASADYH